MADSPPELAEPPPPCPFSSGLKRRYTLSPDGAPGSGTRLTRMTTASAAGSVMKSVTNWKWCAASVAVTSQAIPLPPSEDTV